MDRLDALLQRFSVRARMFHSGTLCATTEFAPEPGVGQLHLLRRGRVAVAHAGGSDVVVDEPSVLFYPRPLAHRFAPEPHAGADLACARVRINDGSANPPSGWGNPYDAGRLQIVDGVTAVYAGGPDVDVEFERTDTVEAPFNCA